MIDLLKNENQLLDVLVWGLKTSGRCTVKSTYLDLIDGDTKEVHLKMKNKSATKDKGSYVVPIPEGNIN
jgi:hypothetical protein